MDSNDILNYLKLLSIPLFNSIKNDDYNKKKSELELFNQLYRKPPGYHNQNAFQSLKNSYHHLPSENGQLKDYNDNVKNLHDYIDKLYEHKLAIDKIDENEKEFLNSRLKMIGSFVLFIFGTVLMADPKYNLFGLAVASGPLVTLFATIPFLAPLIATGYFLYNQDNIAKKNNLELQKIRKQDSDGAPAPDAEKNTLKEISELISAIDQQKANYYSSKHQERGVHLPSASRLQGERQLAPGQMEGGRADGERDRTVDGAGGAIPQRRGGGLVHS